MKPDLAGDEQVPEKRCTMCMFLRTCIPGCTVARLPTLARPCFF